MVHYFIEKLPIYIPDTSDKTKYDHCMKIEEYVKKILEYKKSGKLADADFFREESRRASGEAVSGVNRGSMTGNAQQGSILPC